MCTIIKLYLLISSYPCLQLGSPPLVSFPKFPYFSFPHLDPLFQFPSPNSSSLAHLIQLPPPAPLSKFPFFSSPHPVPIPSSPFFGSDPPFPLLEFASPAPILQHLSSSSNFVDCSSAPPAHPPSTLTPFPGPSPAPLSAVEVAEG